MATAMAGAAVAAAAAMRTVLVSLFGRWAGALVGGWADRLVGGGRVTKAMGRSKKSSTRSPLAEQSGLLDSAF